MSWNSSRRTPMSGMSEAMGFMPRSKASSSPLRRSKTRRSWALTWCSDTTRQCAAPAPVRGGWLGAGGGRRRASRQVGEEVAGEGLAGGSRGAPGDEPLLAEAAGEGLVGHGEEEEVLADLAAVRPHA